MKMGKVVVEVETLKEELGEQVANAAAKLSIAERVKLIDQVLDLVDKHSVMSEIED